MGNYKFRFSDIIPNAWFHKLKHLSKPRSNYSKTLNHTNNKPIVASSSLSSSSATIQQPHLSDKRKSYYLTRDLTFIPDSDTRNLVVEQPRKSSRRRRRRSTKRWPPRLVSKESTNSDHDQSSLSKPDSIFTESRSDKHMSRDSISSSDSSPCKCQVRNDIDKDNHHPLPLIKTMKNEATKLHQRTSAEFSERNAYGSLSVKVVKEDFLAELVGPARKSSHGLVKVVKEDLASELISPARKSSQGVKLRVNSPKIANRRIQGRRSVSSNSSSSTQRSFSGGFAVVKASKDPRRDFKESMVEMIVENNLKASKDLEELLACYLSLNSDEYHDLIINVFKQIWFDYIHHNIK